MKNNDLQPYNDDMYLKNEAYLRAKKKLDNIVGFYWHLASYIVVNIFLIILIGSTSQNGFTNFGTYATAFFWGIGLAFHAAGVFVKKSLFGSEWEKRKIKEFMDKEQQNWQ